MSKIKKQATPATKQATAAADRTHVESLVFNHYRPSAQITKIAKALVANVGKKLSLDSLRKIAPDVVLENRLTAIKRHAPTFDAKKPMALVYSDDRQSCGLETTSKAKK